MYGNPSSSSSRRHRHNNHRHHPYRSGEYFPKDFKKVKHPTFDGEVRNLEDAEAWLLGMKKFFELHDYIENMKAKTTIFSLKGKANIWWEDVKNVKGMHEENFTQNEFERLFKNKYLSEIYFNDRAKDFMSCG